MTLDKGAVVLNSDVIRKQDHLRMNLDQKMAIILPTGQWYAPSAVINDALYCMVFFSNVYFSLILGQAPITANLETTTDVKI